MKSFVRLRSLNRVPHSLASHSAFRSSAHRVCHAQCCSLQLLFRCSHEAAWVAPFSYGSVCDSAGCERAVHALRLASSGGSSWFVVSSRTTRFLRKATAIIEGLFVVGAIATALLATLPRFQRQVAAQHANSSLRGGWKLTSSIYLILLCEMRGRRASVMVNR